MEQPECIAVQNNILAWSFIVASRKAYFNNNRQHWTGRQTACCYSEPGLASVDIFCLYSSVWPHSDLHHQRGGGLLGHEPSMCHWLAFANGTWWCKWKRPSPDCPCPALPLLWVKLPHLQTLEVLGIHKKVFLAEKTAPSVDVCHCMRFYNCFCMMQYSLRGKPLRKLMDVRWRPPARLWSRFHNEAWSPSNAQNTW